METLAPSTEKGIGSERIDFGEAPDTIRDPDLDQQLSGGTEPLFPFPAIASPVVRTEPLAAPLRAPVATVVTPPLVAARPLDAPTYDVYKADDTFRGEYPVHLDDVATDPQRQQTIGLCLLGGALALVITFAGIGSCDDKPSGLVETTSATVTATASAASAAPAPRPTPSATASSTTLTPLPPEHPDPGEAPTPPLRKPAPRSFPKRR
jgi:hypothetical protein